MPTDKPTICKGLYYVCNYKGYNMLNVGLEWPSQILQDSKEL